MHIITGVEESQIGQFTIKVVTFSSEGITDKDWTYVKRGEFVAVLVYNTKRNSFLFVKQIRIPLTEREQNPNLLEVVAGMHDQETVEETAVKEMFEEVNIQAKDISKIVKIAEAYSSPGSTSEFGHFFYAETNLDDVTSGFGGVEEDQEYIERIELPVEKVMLMLKNGKIKDSKTILLLNWWFANIATFEVLKYYRNL